MFSLSFVNLKAALPPFEVMPQKPDSLLIQMEPLYRFVLLVCCLGGAVIRMVKGKQGYELGWKRYSY